MQEACCTSSFVYDYFNDCVVERDVCVVIFFVCGVFVVISLCPFFCCIFVVCGVHSQLFDSGTWRDEMRGFVSANQLLHTKVISTSPTGVSRSWETSPP